MRILCSLFLTPRSLLALYVNQADALFKGHLCPCPYLITLKPLFCVCFVYMYVTQTVRVFSGLTSLDSTVQILEDVTKDPEGNDNYLPESAYTGVIRACCLDGRADKGREVLERLKRTRTRPRLRCVCVYVCLHVHVHVRMRATFLFALITLQ